MRRRRVQGFWLAVILSTGPVATGQIPDADLARAEEPLIVTVSATPVRRASSAAAVMALTREEIENAHADTLGDLLATFPFVHVSRPGHGGALATATIRGGDPNFTLVLVDGVPANDPTNILGGSYDLSALSADNVERIEIVRGPMSSIYGSAASAGVINVITRRGREAPGLAVEGMAGSPPGTGRFRVGGGRRFGNTAFSASGSFLAREGAGDGVDSSLGVVSVGAATELGAGRSLDLLFRYQRQESGVFPENGGGPEYSILRTLKESLAREAVAGVGYRHQLAPGWELRLSWDVFDRRQRTDTPAILDAEPPSSASFPGIESDTSFVRNRLRAANNWTLAPEWTAHLGLSVEEERGTTASTIAGTIPADFRLGRTTLAAIGEVGYRARWLSVNLNLRVDKIDLFGVQVSPGIGAVVPLPGSMGRLRTSWAKAFKAPSFYAVGDPLIGNSGLRPERTRGFDAGIEDIPLPALRAATLSLTYFRNSFGDLIDFSPSLFQLVNRSEALTQGVETYVNVEVSPFASITGHAAHLDWRVAGTSEPLRDRPEWRGGVGLLIEPFAGASLRWDTIWVGRRFDFQIPVPALGEVGGYSTTDVAFTLGLGPLDIFARAENLFDREYHEFIGFPDPGLGLRFGAGVDFR
jgi:outer membrane cobalamin receptor